MRATTLWVSGNFQSHRLIATGPVRSVFELPYEAWDAGGRSVSAVKRISRDAIAEARSGRLVVYYLGAGWSLSGDFADAQAWEEQGRNFVCRILLCGCGLRSRLDAIESVHGIAEQHL
ncbi:MAG: DUF4861 domain-containing protein [Verrucomicrobia bacterium]|jgi:hypothetical protein|nr:DUF4861 domain-containing protein [Verrucomicrobiota bacterium]